MDVVAQLRDQLASGALNRRVHQVWVPFARHRWVKAEKTPEVYTEPDPIRDDEVSAWAEERLRTSNLEPIIGHGWHLECAHTESGRFVLSLLVSHMITDGQGLYNALDAARTGTSSSSIPTSEEVTDVRGVLEDLTDAISQLTEAARAGRIIATAMWRQRHGTKKKAVAAKRIDAPLSGSGTPQTTLAILDVDAHEWTAVARQHGGTSNSLLIAIIGGVVQRTGLPISDGGLRVCIAVNKREDGEDSANASGGVWIRVPDEIGAERGLGGIRALSKHALIEYSKAGNDMVADNLQAVVRLLPRKIIGKMMRSVEGPDATVSNLGDAPQSATTLGGHVAQSFAIRAIMQGNSASDRRRQGPAIAAWAVGYGDKITLSIFGIHPDYFGDAIHLEKHVKRELAEWGLSSTRW
ncbi:hypothetical protein [Rhodococcus sp. 27YEA15]|uniref:hypothetical protein n=1 Tax=Rhodococcus sp. 27YEA15 TaxID=3156259 RepID=UPI003C7E5EDC